MKSSKLLRIVCGIALALMKWGESATGGEQVNPELEKATTFAYYPGLRKLEVRFGKLTLDLLAAGREARIVVAPEGDVPGIARGQGALTENGGMTSISLPELADGTYKIAITVGENGPTALKKFKHKNFSWLGNRLGETDVIYPPFKPIQVKGSIADVVLRTYEMNDFGLWDSVKSEGKELLAAPVALHVQTAGGEQKWQFSKGQWVTVKPHLTVYQAEAAAPAVRVRTKSSLEYDGCMKVEMDLLPGAKADTIQRMWLEIPVKDSEAPLFHFCAFDSMRRNYAGKTPRGGKITWEPRAEQWLPSLWKAEPGSDNGVLWTCRDIRPNTPNLIATDFVPYIWLGGGTRGICFFGNNDKGYLVDRKGIMQKVERQGETVYLRVDLINKPSVITKPSHLVFGLQASPTRPMPENWRLKHKITPAMPGPVVCWGGYNCPDKYPESYHWYVVDEICKIRETGVVDRALFEKFDKMRGEPWKTPWGGTGAPGFDTWLDRDLWYFVDRAKSLHARSDWRTIAAEGVYSEEQAKVLADPVWITYTEEHASDVSEPEWEVFQDEWRAEWPWMRARTELVGQPLTHNNFRFGHQAFPESYIDFAVYYHNEWFKRGVGVYFDNTFPYTMHNPSISDAYYDEDGKIQPACSMWEQRTYYKRVWQSMNEWERKGVPHPLAFAQHITNTRILPWNTWSTISLDIEWEWYPDPTTAPASAPSERPGRNRARLRLPFPPDLLLTETQGRQTGTMGNSHFGILGNPDRAAGFPATYARSEWGMRIVHEIGSRSNNDLEKALWKFGYGSDRTKVIPYWSDDVPVSISDQENNKWIMVARPSDQRLMLVAQTWNKEDTEVQLKIDPKKLGFTPAAQAGDIETGEALPFTANSLSLKLAGPYGTRVIRIGAKE